jgi:hypothetical protein
MKKPNPFEKSAKDKEKKGGPKEGSKKEEAMDVAQMGYKRGGTVKCASGGMMRGTGAATKGKKFQGVF